MDGRISISVVIPVRNAEKTLARAIDSALAQRYAPDEIIVVNDASTDATAAVVHNYHDRGITSVTLDAQRGAAAARNVGIAAAKGDWVAFLDADDEWLALKLEKQLAVLSSAPQTSFVFCASDEFSADGQALGDTFRGWPARSGNGTWKALLAHNFVATPTVVARRDLLLQLGGFDERLKVAEDQDMWIRLALAGSPAYVPETLVRVHVQAESLSSWRLSDQYDYTLPMIERHLDWQRHRLSKSDMRQIMGERLSGIGSIAAAKGDLLHGLAMILRSALLGYRPLRSLRMMATAPLRVYLQKFRLLSRRGRTAA